MRALALVVVFGLLATAAQGVIDVGPLKTFIEPKKGLVDPQLRFDAKLGKTVDKDTGLPTSPARPIVISPGLMGSQIFKDGVSNRMWVRIMYPDKNYREGCVGNYDGSRYNSFSGSICDTDYDRDAGLYAVSRLSDVPTRIGPAEQMYYFWDFIKAARSAGYVPGETLFASPYDFLQSNSHPDEIAKLMSTLSKAQSASGVPATLISHSMGGVRVEAAWALGGTSFSDLVENWIVMSAPLRGAAIAVPEGHIVGTDMGLLKRSTVQGFMLGSPFSYQLLPHGISFDDPPSLKFTLNGADTTVTVSGDLSEYAAFAVEATKDLKVHVSGSTYAPMPYNTAGHASAIELFDVLDSFEGDGSINVFGLWSSGFPTRRHIAFSGDYGSLQDLCEPSAKFEILYGAGDGTVHAESLENPGIELSGAWTADGVFHSDTVKTKSFMAKMFELSGVAVDDAAMEILAPTTEIFHLEEAEASQDWAAYVRRYLPEYWEEAGGDAAAQAAAHDDAVPVILGREIDPTFEWELLDPTTGHTTPMIGNKVRV